MPTTNGHGPKTAILYARVSTDEQARSGYSLAQQLETLREYAATEGYEVLEEVTDPGQSGASLERPGMDRVRDLVAAGGVSVVLAQDRDRFAREPAYLYLLKREFEEYGTKIRALNDRGDDTPEGELTDEILDQLAKFERAKTAERTRRGRLRKAKEGKVMAGRSPRYGFRVNASRDGYEVDEEKMRVVRRIFRMVAEGTTVRAIKLTFEREGIPTPKGVRFWDRSFFRNCVLDDVYRPHSFEEVATVVSPEVAAHLDPTRNYGLWWFNRRRMTSKPVSEVSENGRRYSRKYTSYTKPKEEWIAVPVPDSGIPRELVDAAREAIKGNRVPSRAGERFWELSGGVGRCAECGRRLRTIHRRKQRKSGPRSYGYYRCPGYHDQAAEGLMSLDKLREKLAALEDRQKTVERELEALKGRREELEQLERHRDAVIGYYAALAPKALDSLGPEQRHRLYGMLRLIISVDKDGQVWAEMPIRLPVSLEKDRTVYQMEVTSRSALMDARS